MLLFIIYRKQKEFDVEFEKYISLCCRWGNDIGSKLFSKQIQAKFRDP